MLPVAPFKYIKQRLRTLVVALHKQTAGKVGPNQYTDILVELRPLVLVVFERIDYGTHRAFPTAYPVEFLRGIARYDSKRTLTESCGIALYSSLRIRVVNRLGIFPKLELTFRDGLTENEVSQIINLLDQPYFNVTYFSPKTKGTVTARYYASDYAPELLDKARGLYKTFTVSLVPVGKL